MTEGNFAFGGNVIGGCECPAKAAGFDPSSFSLEQAVKLYDRKAKSETGNWEGTVHEETAREQWMSVVQNEQNHLNKTERKAATKVAVALGWEDSN